jgi:hypothetical protein
VIASILKRLSISFIKPIELSLICSLSLTDLSIASITNIIKMSQELRDLFNIEVDEFQKKAKVSMVSLHGRDKTVAGHLHSNDTRLE